MTFLPTHRHVDGGFYHYIGEQLGKSEFDGEWVPGVAYRNDEGMMFWTSLERWGQRFTPQGIENSSVTLTDKDDEVVAAFNFQHGDAGDVRYMLVSAGPLQNSRLTIGETSWIKTVLKAQAEAVTRGLHIRDHDFPDFIGDVSAFHAKFGQEYLGKPRMLPADLHDFRVKFHDEETGEYRDEYPKLLDAIERKDRRDIINILELQLDALADAAWVILGTADLQFGRRAFYEAWRRVVTANMAKVRAVDDSGAQDSGREVKYDIRKPAGWQAPDHRDLVQDNAIFDEIFHPEATQHLADNSGKIIDTGYIGDGLNA